ncbi:hypothetical protein [Uliginosibacterium aquaticum]|uniref:Uncharacterized protein n=1 Tax=Uliginosibacterium aquaticum TaxID=2731212 RepID=A0ABX2IMU0_9RHOO|nr:hypothetical protein [Uliginosibacterium aquaticum]NSL55989.1 hypothetical protein [Uliginosibacterium aquaticum]
MKLPPQLASELAAAEELAMLWVAVLDVLLLAAEAATELALAALLAAALLCPELAVELPAA